MSKVQRSDLDIEWEAIPGSLRKEIMDDYTQTRGKTRPRENWETLLHNALNSDPVQKTA